MAILSPEQMDFSDKNFSMIISGSPGIGKTTLALSSPDPILIDFDKGISRVRAQHRTLTICSNTYEEVKEDMKSQVFQECKTVVIDTGGSFITYLQDWAIRTNPTANKQKNSDAISQKGFGAVKAEFINFTNRVTYTMNKNVIYIFHTVEEKDGDTVRYRLLCEGSAKNIVWQPCDLGCFMYMEDGKRMLGFTPTENYFAKGCYGIQDRIEVPKLDTGMPNDFLTRLFEKARKNIAAEVEEYGPKRAVYEAAMQKVREILADVTGAETATEAAKAMREIEHALTSEKEGKALFSAKVKELGLSWDKEGGRYVTTH